jgi:hypothetical protein
MIKIVFYGYKYINYIEFIMQVLLYKINCTELENTLHVWDKQISHLKQIKILNEEL